MDIKTAVIEYLNEKYNDEIKDKLLDMASLLDLRFKAIKTRAVTEILKMEGDQGPSIAHASCRTEEIRGRRKRCCSSSCKETEEVTGQFF